MEVDKPVVNKALCDGLNKGEVVVSDVGATIPGVSAATLPRFLLDLARAVAAGSLQADKLVVAVKASGVEATADALGADLADALWYAWQEAEGDASGDAKTRLADAAKEALKEQLVTKPQLLESGEGEFFEWCGFVVNKEVWRKKEIRVHTKHTYTQRKFNLLREESEGYAKLATLLNQRAAGCLTAANAPAVLAEMKALIGYFDLDPNRCFSLVLDAFSQQPVNDAFLALLPAFSSDAATQLLGFHFFRCRADEAAQRPAQPAPAGLYVAAAKMVRAGATSLEALMAHLSPADDELRSAYEEGAKRMAEGISRIGIISLVSAADTASAPLAPPGLGLRREPSGVMGAGGAAGGGAEQNPRAKSGLTASALELAAAPYAAPLTAVAAGNQKLLLLAAFLQIGDWEHAQKLMRWLACLGLSDFAVFPAVGQALAAFIGRELQPVYEAAASSAGASAGGQAAPALALPRRLLDLLAVAGQHLYHNVTVLTKLVRVLAVLLAANHGLHPRSKQQHEQILELLTQSVLPALALVPGNAGLVYEIWAALKQLPYTDRFCLYADTKEGMRGSPLLTAAAKLAETEVRRILRRVTAPANKKEAKATMKPLGRMLAKIMHSAPLAVVEQLIRQVMGMPGMVTSIVESLKYLTPMAFDVMTFAVLKQLASPKKKLKDDGVNLGEWYQWLAAFTGLLCKKHGQEVEVTALLQYVANQLKSSESLDLLVLKEMVATMTGHQAVFDVSEHQLDALAGSDTLKAEVITQGEHRSSDKSLQRASARLLQALMCGASAEERLAMPLLVLLAQQRKLIVLQSQSTHLKLIAELYDKCQEVCTQYAEFLQHALPAAEYAALLPSMEDLAAEYCVDPELIFSLYRPLIRGILPPAALGPPPAPDHEEEGELVAGEQEEGEASAGGAAVEGAAAGKGGKAAGKGGAGGAAPMEEDGQLEAGEVLASPGATAAAAKPAAGPLAGVPDAAAAAQRWAELEAQVRAIHAVRGAAGGAESDGGGGTNGERLPFKGMSLVLYTTFWALQLYDLEVPAPRYESTISQLRTDIRIAQGDIENAKREVQRPGQYFGGHGGFGFRGPPPSDAPGLTVDVEQLQKDIERAQAALEKLPGELADQQANAAAVERRLQMEKGCWVLEGAAARGALPREFVQFCVLPRMLNSPTDALYCARFLRKVHLLDVPGFNLLQTINHVMKEFGFLVRVCTPREATNFGIFMNEVLALVERWRQPDVFARECANAQTFRVAAKPSKAAAPAPAPAAPTPATSGSPAAAAPAAGAAAEPAAAAADGQAAAAAPPAAALAATPPPLAAPAVRNVDHRDWVNLTHNWQKTLTEAVFASCIQSRDYMQAKNALLALNRCVKVYPAIKTDANKLIDLLKPIRDKDPREDLKTLARMYCTALEMQMRDKARNMAATREEYAGLPPKKRPARPAASKGAAPSEGKPAAASGGGKGEPKGKAEAGGEQKKGTGEGAAAAEGKAAGREGEKEGRRATDSSKGPPLPPGMGVSGARRGEQPRERERDRGQQQQQQQADRRRDERGAATKDGPPPGFGSADKLKHAGSTTELRPAERERRERERQQQDRSSRGRPGSSGSGKEEAGKEQAEDKGQQKGRAEPEKEQERGKAGTALRPEAAPFVPRPASRGGRAEEEAAERDAKRPRREEPSPAAASAAAASGREQRERGAERAERGERAAERAERPSGRPPAAPAGERGREHGREADGSAHDRSAKPGRGSDAAPAAAGGGRDERPGSGGRQRPREEEMPTVVVRGEARPEARGRASAADRPERGSQRAEQRDRHAGASEAAAGGRERDRGAPEAEVTRRGTEEHRRDEGAAAAKRKREEEEPPGSARHGARTAGVRDERERGQPASAAAADRGRERASHDRREEKQAAAPAAAGHGTRDVEDARAAARAAAQAGTGSGERHNRGGREEQAAREDKPAPSQRQPAPAAREEQREGRPERRGGAAGAEKGEKEAAEREAGSEGGSEGERDRSRKRSRDKGERKEKRKRDKKDKKHSRKERSKDRGAEPEEAPAAPAPAPGRAAAPAEDERERDSKRRRQDEPDVPERLKGRLQPAHLGSGLLGSALKDIVQGAQHAAPPQQHDRGERRGGGGGRGEQQQPQLEREGSGRARRDDRRHVAQREAEAEEEVPRRMVREEPPRREGRRGGRRRG